jgi:hypothetical protein
MPPVDLIIRTENDCRTSNFLPLDGKRKWSSCLFLYSDMTGILVRESVAGPSCVWWANAWVWYLVKGDAFLILVVAWIISPECVQHYSEKYAGIFAHREIEMIIGYVL